MGIEDRDYMRRPDPEPRLVKVLIMLVLVVALAGFFVEVIR